MCTCQYWHKHVSVSGSAIVQLVMFEDSNLSEYNDIQDNDIQHNDIQHNDIQ